MPQIVAVDFGGTHIRTAYFPTPSPQPESQSKIQTRAEEGVDAVLSHLIAEIEALLPAARNDVRIGVGAPGPLDPFSGIILDTPNLPGWVNVPIRDKLSAHFKCPVSLGNDANVAALGEWRFGAGSGKDNLIYLTISTGIGGGVITDGKLLLGAKGLGGELGHMVVDMDGPICSCGHTGHLEAFAAGPAIARRALEQIRDGRDSSLSKRVASSGELSARDVGDAAIAGDPLAVEIVEDTGFILGKHMASLSHAFNPEIFIIGGGVSQIGAILFDSIKQALHESLIHPAYQKELDVVPAALGDDAGLVGAMVLASDS
jgi:glucokinase